MSNNGITLAWFEGICVELNRNPMQATAVLTEFQEQEYALEAVNSYLCDPSCSPPAQFQASLIMQYNSLKNWSRLSSAQKLQLRDTIFSLIGKSIINSTMPPYALNKVMQVYALFWKRDWKEQSIDQQVLFQQISSMLQSTPEAFRQGCILLRILVEEFASRSSAEAGLPIEFHREAHESFEKQGLDQSIHLSIQTLSAAFQMHDAAAAIPAVAEAVKLFSEVLSWDFGQNQLTSIFKRKSTHTDSSSSYSSAISGQLLHVPRRWAEMLLQPSLVSRVADMYVRTRMLLEQTINSAAGFNGEARVIAAPNGKIVTEYLRCLADLRLLLVSLASLSGQVYSTDTERLAFGQCIMARAVPLLDNAVASRLDSSVVDDLRAQECENLGTVFLRLLSNFRLGLCCQMPSFDAMMMSLGKTTFELSKELAGLAEQQLRRIYHPGAPNDSKYETLAGEPALLEGWRGDAVVLFLDVWCMVLDDPLMLHMALMEPSGILDASVTKRQVSTQLKLGLRGMAAEVFQQLFESMWRITICEALAEPDEEEDEENEAIAVRNLDDMLASICTVGRTHFSQSLEQVRGSIARSLDEAEKAITLPLSTPGLERESLRILESLRVSVLFLGHLCDDTFRGKAMEKSSEAPLIPSFILDSCLHSPETMEGLRSAVGLVARLLQLQIHLAAPENGRGSSNLFSPLLLQITMRFFTEYCVRFVDPDPSLYSTNTVASIPYLFASDPSLSHSPANAELAALLELLLSAVHTLLVVMPLESDLIQAMSELVGAMAKMSRNGRLASLLSSPSVGRIFQVVTGPDCRLNLDGTSQIYRSLACLAARAGTDSMMMQLCGYVHSSGQALPVLASNSGELKLKAQQFISRLLGLSTCPRGQDKVLHSLFDACLPIIAWIIAHSGLSAEDDVMMAILRMLGSYAETKLAGLCHQSSSVLYQTALSTLQAFSTRLGGVNPLTLKTTTTALTTTAAEEEETFRSESVLYMLELLNSLSSKDFVFDDDEDVAAGGEGERGYAFHMSVAEVLQFGLDLVVQLITADLLRNFPRTADCYFSFVAFMTSTYSQELGGSLSVMAPSEGVKMLGMMMSHLLWGAGAIDAGAARMALQGIQNLASFQFTSMGKQDPGVGLAVAAEVFSVALDKLLEMIFFPMSCEYGIGWDRADSCGHALISLIVLDTQRYVLCDP